MHADGLYALPLDQFIPERTALARSLRSQGRREEAKQVAAARKPSVAAWAVNQLVRTQVQALDELFEAGDALRAAQDQVLGGHGDRTGLRAAAEGERHALDELVKAARGLLTSEGHELSPAIIERVSETLHAAALDDEARRQVEGATLQRELRHVGFGAGAGAAASPAPPRSRAPKKRAAAGKTPSKGEADRPEPREQDREERRRGERERAAALKAARTAEGEARRAARRAARALEVAQERRDRTAQALTDAEEELEKARREADGAAEAHRAAAAELEQLMPRGSRDDTECSTGS